MGYLRDTFLRNAMWNRDLDFWSENRFNSDTGFYITLAFKKNYRERWLLGLGVSSDVFRFTVDLVDLSRMLRFQNDYTCQNGYMINLEFCIKANVIKAIKEYKDKIKMCQTCMFKKECQRCWTVYCWFFYSRRFLSCRLSIQKVHLGSWTQIR